MIVVTGGAGFIGSAFVAKLNEQDITDILVVDNLAKTEKWKNLVGKKFVDYLHKNEFLDKLKNDDFKGELSAIIHMGACSATTELDADYLMENNYKYSKTLAKCAIENKINFLYASSAATYGDGSNGFSDMNFDQLRPLNMYGYSKHLFDQWAINSGAIDFITGFKFFNVYGPNEYHKKDMSSVVFKAFHQIKDTGKLKLFNSYHPDFEDGKQMRDFIYVKDVVDLIFRFMQNPKPGIFNMGTGRARTWIDLGKAVFAAMEVPENIEIIEMPKHLRGKYQYFTEADMTKFKNLNLDFEFSSLEEGVADYIKKHLATENPFY